MMDIEIIVPRSADETDQLDFGLVSLTQAIAQLDPDLVAHGFLGGEFGYGAHWENDVFLMHPYCWCEKDDCPWCCGCDCPGDSFHYFIGGIECTYREWADFFEAETARFKGDHDAWMVAADAANERRSERHDAVC